MDDDRMKHVLEVSVPRALGGEIASKKIMVLHACVTGSRLWGTHTPASDFDVRFIYRHPVEAYLSLDRRKPALDLGVVDDGDGNTLDIKGFDIFKAFDLLRRANAQVLEWLRAPEHAVAPDFACPEFNESALEVARNLFGPEALLENYRGQMREALPVLSTNGAAAVAEQLAGYAIPTKGLLYTLRGAVNAWVIQALGSYPPPSLHDALSLPFFDEQGWSRIRYVAQDLISARRAGETTSRIPPPLCEFIAAVDAFPRRKYAPDPAALFRATERLNDILGCWIN